MFHRFHRPKRGGSPSGKWQHIPHSGVGTVHSETEGDWTITVTHRRTGTTIRRDVYNVLLRSNRTSKEESLTGFASKPSALAAARRRIAFLSSVKKRRDQRNVWPTP